MGFGAPVSAALTANPEMSGVRSLRTSGVAVQTDRHLPASLPRLRRALDPADLGSTKCLLCTLSRMLRAGIESLAAKLLSSSARGGSFLWRLERSLGDVNSVVRISSASFRAKSDLFDAKPSRPQRWIQPPLCSSIRLFDDSLQDHARCPSRPTHSHRKIPASRG